MSDYRCPRLNEDDLLSQSSDERMDTASESFRSQDTPNSILSSDFDDKSIENNVLRLQNPQDNDTNNVLRLSEPEQNDNIKNKVTTKLKTELNDSFVTKMSNLNLNSPNIENRPKNLGLSPPKFCSSLVLTTNHPLMGLSSPDNYPDVIPKKVNKEDEKESLSSIEDERQETNSYEFYSPQLNNSKNNLYFSENFVTAESHDSIENNLTPDVARVKAKRRKIIPKFVEESDVAIDSPVRVDGRVHEDSPMINYIDAKKIKFSSHSTPRANLTGFEIPEDFGSEVFNGTAAEWCESPAHSHCVPNFDLPIELTTNITVNNDIESPDLLSSSTQEDKSAYQALLDPYTGSVALRPTAPRSPGTQRRKIQLPPEEDSCSLDNVSVSMDSEEEPEPVEIEKQLSDEEVVRSQSTNTVSECSEPIPEYSAVEELSEERSWLTVRPDLTCDMKVIEPYKRVLSHGGYDPRGAIIVFSACYLPDNSRPDYKYVMDNLFLYVIWTMERLVTDEYVLVYLHGGGAGGRMPTLRWLHQCYRLVDHRLRKSLKHLYMVHPTFLLRSFVVLTKPFVSSKFFRKLSYVRTLDELMQQVRVDPNAIPEPVKRHDSRR